jgi:fatty acid CoA ligase FadD9
LSWLFSVVATGIAPKSFYRDTDNARRAHYDGLPVDFTAAAIATLGENALEGYRTYHVLNPHDDGVSLDTFVDWVIEAGYRVQRMDDYGDWYQRFETALRALPEAQRQHSSLPLLHQLKEPATASEGASIPAPRFHADVRKYGVGATQDIPPLSAALIRKYLADLQLLGWLPADAQAI